MSSLLKTIVSVLLDVSEVPELPMDRLIALPDEGVPVEHTFSTQVFLRIARLQTLLVREAQKGEMPELDEIKQVEKGGTKDTAEVMADFLAVQEDAGRRAGMLQQLITEVVRETVPTECERFDVEYFAHPDGRVYHRPLHHHRVLD